MRQFELEGGTGSVAPAEHEITVLVTGFGPFLDDFPVNSSWSIASTLPKYLPATATTPIGIRLVVPEEPIEVAWKTTLEKVPKLLLSEDPKYDIILHMGLAAGRKYFALERQSFRENYRAPDVNGLTPPTEECHQLFGPCPRVLKPTFDCEDVWRRWRDNVTDATAEVQCSDDPGNYLCGFIYFLSMSWFWRKHAVERPVAFLHVPDLPTPENVEQGRQVAIGLIRALAQSRSKLGVQDPLKTETEDETSDEKPESTWAGY